MKLVRESLNEIKRNTNQSGLASIGVGHVGTHGKFFETMNILMPNGIKLLNEKRNYYKEETLRNFNNGNLILNKASKLLKCLPNQMLIAWTRNNDMYTTDDVAIAHAFVTATYENFQEAADCINNNIIDEKIIVDMLSNLDLTYTTIQLKEEKTEREDIEEWTIKFFPKLRVAWVNMNPELDDSADSIVIFC